MLGYDSIERASHVHLVNDIYFHAEDRETQICISPRAQRGLQLLWKKKNGAPIWFRSTPPVHDAQGDLMFGRLLYDIRSRNSPSSNSLHRTRSGKQCRCCLAIRSLRPTPKASSRFSFGAERMLGLFRGRDDRNAVGHRPAQRDELADHTAQLKDEFGLRLSGFDILAHRADRKTREREWTYVKKDGSTITCCCR